MLLLKALESLAAHPAHRPQAGPALAGSMSHALTRRVLLPCLVWRAGHTAAAIRGSCITLLLAFLEQQWLEGAALESLLQVGSAVSVLASWALSTGPWSAIPGSLTPQWTLTY